MIELNKQKNIGRVLFIVEGSKSEFVILRKIFCDILQYEYIEKRRNQPDTFQSKNSSFSRVAVINTKESNIRDITENESYLDDLFDMLITEYNFPVDQAAIYYLFDRDPESNTDVDRIKDYIATLRNPYDNGIMKAGLLLLSYPSIEAFIVSGFVDKSYEIRKNLGSEVKKYIGENTFIQNNKINENTLIKATGEFLPYLRNLDVEWDIDDFSGASRTVLDKQQEEYLAGKGFRLFSMLTLALLQMGIISYQE